MSSRGAADTSKGKQALLESRASTSDQSSQNLADKGRWRRKDEIKQFEERLRLLEEETDMLKGDFSDTIEERRKLVDEIHEKFETIHQYCVLKREAGGGQSYATRGGCTIISVLEQRRRAGLLQILCQESNPTLLVNKSLKADGCYGL